jgi:hypothetical protein
MKTFIINIYRWDDKDRPNIVGTIEEVGVGGKQAFENIDDLWAILNPFKKCIATRRVSRKKRTKV